jgi:hypothetical protein
MALQSQEEDPLELFRATSIVSALKDRFVGAGLF